MKNSKLTLPDNVIIAIDGPVCAGKGRVVELLCSQIPGLKSLNSGLLWRAAAYIQKGPFDIPELSRITYTGGSEIKIDGAVVEPELLTSEEAAQKTSKFASIPATREIMLRFIRETGAKIGQFVAEGRDMGTVVFPDTALLKVYLTADTAVRAKRLMQDPSRSGTSELTFLKAYASVAERDLRDRNRKVAPLVPADDAIVIDTGSIFALDVAKIIRELLILRLAA